MMMRINIFWEEIVTWQLLKLQKTIESMAPALLGALARATSNATTATPAPTVTPIPTATATAASDLASRVNVSVKR